MFSVMRSCVMILIAIVRRRSPCLTFVSMGIKSVNRCSDTMWFKLLCII
uniref:Uncharacterized protein n=1 Tax=Arundo donax TaxID=35708 RepID=A0A0A8ZHB5_ARUDO